MSTVLEAPQYAGILNAIRRTVDNILDDGAHDGAQDDSAAQDEIDDDIDGEKETLLEKEVVAEDSAEDSSDDSEGDSKMADLTRMHAVIAEASKGVTEGTDAEYKRYRLFFSIVSMRSLYLM